jgi:putative ABC transport system ATP-binding protein
MLITIKNLWKTYPMGKITVDALKGVNLEIAKGGFVAVAGSSGSGKTTLMNIIGLIDKPSGGNVLINDKETSGLSKKEIVAMRQNVIGFIFQAFNLLPVLNVFENVELPLIIRKSPAQGVNPTQGASPAQGRQKKTKAERRERVRYLLEEVGLEDRMKHKPSELSGGQQQRVAIARALVNQPEIVIADEPTANLDSGNGKRILELLKKVNRDEGTTLIFSTHDPHIWEMADHIVFLRDGVIDSEERR